MNSCKTESCTKLGGIDYPAAIGEHTPLFGDRPSNREQYLRYRYVPAMTPTKGVHRVRKLSELRDCEPLDRTKDALRQECESGVCGPDITQQHVHRRGIH
jgi:hypothetical protein